MVAERVPMMDRPVSPCPMTSPRRWRINRPAATDFGSLNRSDRYSVLVQLQWVAPQRRAKRISVLVAMLADGKTPGASTKSTAVHKRNVVERMFKKDGRAYSSRMLSN
ncbi:hypothetical protein BDV28DRAFT_133812 [Aspergillus coremiiformis]|uniref:Uncharacterized protein n=1 Tax=Aspergillus coremiiformis TaxID=138285 RepID=A0A5N6Z5Y0_9EURO|nr:hypothetical protein BDV28DRAFT_133812 [Aspergillus coremiiformis]